MIDLIQHLPDYYKGSPEMVSIQASLTKVMRELWDNRESFGDQLIPSTATWGLNVWEDALGLMPATEATQEARRERIEMKLHGVSPATPTSIASLAAVTFGGAMEVIEYPEEYRIEIRSLETIGTPERLNDLNAQLKDILPAHISWSYLIRFLTWADIEGMYPTWGDIEGKSWGELMH